LIRIIKEKLLKEKVLNIFKMDDIKIITKDAKETICLGGKLAKLLKPGDIIGLFGELGSGKTTFVKGIASGLGLKKESVNSPTFVLMNIYQGKMPIYHFDLYRLEDKMQIEEIGYEDFLYAKGVSLVEWAEKAKDLMPKEYLRIYFRHKTINEREIRIVAKGKRYLILIKELNKK